MTEHGPQDRPEATWPGPVGPGGMVNAGISITGGTVSGIVAGGQNAHVTVNQAAPGDDRLARAEQLLKELEARANVLDAPEAEQIRDNVGRLRGELQHERPDTGRIKQLLARLAMLAAPVGSLLELVNQVKELVH